MPGDPSLSLRSNRLKLHFCAAALAAIGLLAVDTASAQAQSAAADSKGAWPTRAITLVVPYPPGGSTDIVGRHLGARLSERLGQPVVVENRAGAATAIGASAVARAPRDGYTLLISASTTFTVNPHLNDNLGYKLADFAPIAPVAALPFAFVVRKDFPAANLAEFIAYAKANPGKINNGTNGQATLVHLFGELIAQELGVQLTQVHYKGAAPATADMLGGVIDSNTEALTTALPHIVDGRFRALAVLSPKRLPSLPDVPTFTELGYPQIVGETLFAVFAPAGTPAPVLARLNKELTEITSSEAFGEFMRKLGSEAKTGSADELLAQTRAQSDRWGELIRRLGIKAQ